MPGAVNAVDDRQRVGRSAWKVRGGALMATVTIHAHDHALPAGAYDAQFEKIAEEAFRHYARVWKPGTLAVNRSYLANQILPWFRGRPIADVTRAHVQRWFASLHATPAAADRSLPILSAILRHAEIEDVRLHDLRHTFVSYAVLQSVPLPSTPATASHSIFSRRCFGGKPE
jgi:hypothetical protein